MPQSIEMQAVDRKTRAGQRAIPKTYRSPTDRIQDFAECSMGFSVREAQKEAARCLHCPEPAACVLACPIENDIPTILWHVEQGDFITAAEMYRQNNPLPEICGRVCPDESSCATSCVLVKRGKGINTQAIEMFVADYQREHGGVPLPPKDTPTGKKVAIIGAGPAGMTVAEDLTIKGHEVTVYDAMPTVGGLLVYGIPNFKLDKSLVQWKADWLRELGINFVMNTRIGEDVTLDDLLDKEGYDAIFLGTGSLVEATMNIPGENLDRVYKALQFLACSNLPKEMLPPDRCGRMTVGNRVAVIGGGDTATDCMRTAIRLGAKDVICYYRRSETEMPGNAKERHHAEEESAYIEYLTAPIEILDLNGDGKVDAMKMIKMALGEPDPSGRRRPIPITGSEYIVEVDDVVLAIGFWPDPLLGETTKNLDTHKWGLIEADELTGQTSRPEIFAGGDNVTGPSLVNAAIAAGKRAAISIHDYIMAD